MNLIEEKIKKECNYEIKKSSNDILSEYSLRKTTQSRSFHVDFKYLFGGLGVAFAGLMIFAGIKLTKPNNPTTPIDYSDETIVSLSQEQYSECNEIACEMMPAITFVDYYLSTNTNNDEVGNNEIAYKEFLNIKRIIDSLYVDEYSELTLRRAEYNIEDVSYCNLLTINENAKIYFEKDILDENSDLSYIKGLFEVDGQYCKVSKKTFSDKDYQYELTIFLPNNEKITIKTKEDGLIHYNFSKSVDKDRIYELDIIQLEGEYDYNVNVNNDSILGFEDTSRDKINYCIKKVDSTLTVNYKYKGSESIYGTFEF